MVLIRDYMRHSYVNDVSYAAGDNRPVQQSDRCALTFLVISIQCVSEC